MFAVNSVNAQGPLLEGPLLDLEGPLLQGPLLEGPPPASLLCCIVLLTTLLVLYITRKVSYSIIMTNFIVCY